MLVLTRKKGEKLIVTIQPHDKPIDLVITLVRSEFDKARIGIEGDKEVVNVVREELIKD